MKIFDPELKKLAQDIIVSQQNEITQMKAILERLHHEREEANYGNN
ncbi:MAG: DUF305 domain-containing protein [Pedobacter sp.]|nr:MAG: DUF305 domain-containing protein [Pedobacter sp.]